MGVIALQSKYRLVPGEEHSFWLMDLACGVGRLPPSSASAAQRIPALSSGRATVGTVYRASGPQTRRVHHVGFTGAP